MAVFLGACLGLQADDKGISAEAQVKTDRDNPGATVRTDRNDRDVRVYTDRDNGKLSRGDASFIREAVQGGNMEVKMGQHAKDHAANADVKAYGERLVKDHTEANKKLTELAGQKGLDLAKATDADDARKGGKMAMDWEGKHGADFDKAFIKHAIKDHKKDIEKFEKASRSSEDSDLRSFAANTLPTLREHQMEAERIAKALGVDINVSDASEYRDASGVPAVSVETQNRVDRVDVDVDRDRDAKIETKIETDNSKGDGKTLGVETKAGDDKTLGLETRKGDGKTLGIQTGPGDGRTLGLNTSKDDGKLLGIFPAPGHKKDEARVDVDIDRDDHRVQADVGGPAPGEKGSAKVEASADTDAKVMVYNDLPAKVQTTIKNEGGSAKTKVKKHTYNGKTAYKVEIEKNGRNRVIEIAEDGTIFKDNNAK